MIYVKPAVMELIDSKQFGTVTDSCTTYALISMLHTWNKDTDGNGSTTRVMTFDFRKAFDLRLLHMMNVRFCLLNMAQRILGVTLPNF
jgi:hypothetical protein